MSVLFTGFKRILKSAASEGPIVFLLTIAAASCLLGQEKKYVGSIVFTGNQYISSHELLSVMQLKPPDFFSRHSYDLSTLIDDIEKIKNLYKRYGFFNADVRIGPFFTDTTNNEVLFQIDISENARTLIDSIIFINGELYSGSFLSEQIPLKTGAPFDSSLFTQSKLSIKNLLTLRGHLFAEVTSDLVLDEQAHRAIAVYIIKEGPVVKSGDIEIVGADKLKRSVIIRELDFENKIITTENLTRSIFNLNQTKLFDAVSVEPLDTGIYTCNLDTIIVPVVVQVHLADMFTYQAGGGYNTHDGLYGLIEPSYKNLFSLGHRVSGLLQASSLLTGGNLNYYYPWFLTLPLSANLMLYIEKRNEFEYSGLFRGGLFSLDGSLNQQSWYSIWISIENTVWIRFTQSESDNSDDQAGNIALIGTAITHDTRKSPSNPDLGMVLHIQPEISGPGISWSSKFFKIQGDVSVYFQVFRTKLDCTSSLTAGFITPYGNSKVVPAQELFTVTEEGIPTIRGYAESEILIPNESGTIKGGRLALVITPLEVVFPFYNQVSGAVFIDGGFIWPLPQDFSVQDLQWSIGPGVRIDSPFGIIKIDYGIQLGGKGNLSGRLHFRAGTEF
ncbi:MAG TPA: BamA/TamA family outer membrane protein [Chitinispirillaceae bacterium]|nr:BamA/TamA family outer membrane protein [Chitinispirillaceae bacterium]